MVRETHRQSDEQIGVALARVTLPPPPFLPLTTSDMRSSLCSLCVRKNKSQSPPPIHQLAGRGIALVTSSSGEGEVTASAIAACT